MKKEVKKLWVNALRSGEYRQIPNHFSDDRGGFCLMGVLGDLYFKSIGITNASANAIGNAFAGRLPAVLTTYVESPILEWAGIAKYSEFGHLIEANNQGVPFNILATWIEEHVPDEDTPDGPGPTSLEALEQAVGSRVPEPHPSFADSMEFFSPDFILDRLKSVFRGASRGIAEERHVRRRYESPIMRLDGYESPIMRFYASCL